MLERIKSIGRKEEKRLDVLGMTLCTAWPGNGDLFYSILMWDENHRISREIYSFEYQPAEDQSASAEWMREIFESWFTRACRDQWPLP